MKKYVIQMIYGNYPQILICDYEYKNKFKKMNL